ncbi:MAG: copper chaperone PCu(A)C [Balneolaceae bacterium]|jgi:copper(I)-binding protein
MKKIFALFLTSLIFWGCNSKSDKNGNNRKVVLGKIEVSGGWARPGAEGQNSAAYMTVTNGTASIDTLTGASSNVSQEAELHESYETESGQSGMRPVGKLIIDSGDKLHIAPGGYHIMLMKLKNDLAEGDSLELTLDFQHAGPKTVRIPVKIQN